ncbi:MAG: acyl-CoA dehydrogenase [Syntrophaceae bacterium]|nr:acyl-CoA dehydrogenase [Syntrophaceae bacterium]
MNDTLVNKRDQEFVLFEQIGIDRLISRDAFCGLSGDDVLMMRDEAEKMALHVFLPAYAEGDRLGCVFENGGVRVPPSFKDAYRKFVENGWLCPAKCVEVGGQGLPISVMTACVEFFYAANFPLLMYPGLTLGAAGLIERFGTPVQKEKYMLRMYQGEWTGTMCLTEANAGTDVGALRTRALRLPDGTYSIIGTKCFITGGDHDITPNIVHIVLARIEGDPPGTPGLSVFIVPKFRVREDGSLGEHNDVQTGNVEHKMGIHGSATCTLNFGDHENCIGELLGKEREGLHVMFNLMNEARLEVGMQGLGHATAAYEHALAYARERIQSAPVWEMHNPEASPIPIIGHPDVRRNLLWMKAHVEGMRAMNYYAAYCMDMAEIVEDEKERADWSGLVELLIPVCKAYCSDTGLLVCSKAIDVFGGYGYCSECPVEQYMRDCKISSIYEGTNGVQALDLVGRKLGERGGANVVHLFGRMAETVQRATKIEALQQGAAVLGASLQALKEVTEGFAGMAKTAGFLIPILYASPYLHILGDVLLGHFLFEGAAIACQRLQEIYQAEGVEDSPGGQRALVHDHDDVAFYQGKVAAAKFFANEVLMTVKGRCKAILSAERAPLEMADESF